MSQGQYEHASQNHQRHPNKDWGRIRLTYPTPTLLQPMQIARIDTGSPRVNPRNLD